MSRLLYEVAVLNDVTRNREVQWTIVPICTSVNCNIHPSYLFNIDAKVDCTQSKSCSVTSLPEKWSQKMSLSSELYTNSINSTDNFETAQTISGYSSTGFGSTQYSDFSVSGSDSGAWLKSQFIIKDGTLSDAKYEDSEESTEEISSDVFVPFGQDVEAALVFSPVILRRCGQEQDIVGGNPFDRAEKDGVNVSNENENEEYKELITQSRSFRDVLLGFGVSNGKYSDEEKSSKSNSCSDTSDIELEGNPSYMINQPMSLSVPEPEETCAGLHTKFIKEMVKLVDANEDDPEKCAQPASNNQNGSSNLNGQNERVEHGDCDQSARIRIQNELIRSERIRNERIRNGNGDQNVFNGYKVDKISNNHKAKSTENGHSPVNGNSPVNDNNPVDGNSPINGHSPINDDHVQNGNKGRAQNGHKLKKYQNGHNTQNGEDAECQSAPAQVNGHIHPPSTSLILEDLEESQSEMSIRRIGRTSLEENESMDGLAIAPKGKSKNKKKRQRMASFFSPPCYQDRLIGCRSLNIDTPKSPSPTNSSDDTDSNPRQSPKSWKTNENTEFEADSNEFPSLHKKPSRSHKHDTANRSSHLEVTNDSGLGSTQFSETLDHSQKVTECEDIEVAKILTEAESARLKSNAISKAMSTRLQSEKKSARPKRETISARLQSKAISAKLQTKSSEAISAKVQNKTESASEAMSETISTRLQSETISALQLNEARLARQQSEERLAQLKSETMSESRLAREKSEARLARELSEARLARQQSEARLAQLNSEVMSESISARQQSDAILARLKNEATSAYYDDLADFQINSLNNVNKRLILEGPPYKCKIQHGSDFKTLRHFLWEWARAMPGLVQTPDNLETLLSISQRVVRITVRKPYIPVDVEMAKEYQLLKNVECYKDHLMTYHYGTGFCFYIDHQRMYIRTHSNIVSSPNDAKSALVQFNIQDMRCNGDVTIECNGLEHDFENNVYSSSSIFMCATPPELINYLYVFSEVPIIQRTSAFENDSCYFTDSGAESSSLGFEESNSNPFHKISNTKHIWNTINNEEISSNKSTDLQIKPQNQNNLSSSKQTTNPSDSLLEPSKLSSSPKECKKKPQEAKETEIDQTRVWGGYLEDYTSFSCEIPKECKTNPQEAEETEIDHTRVWGGYLEDYTSFSYEIKPPPPEDMNEASRYVIPKTDGRNIPILKPNPKQNYKMELPIKGVQNFYNPFSCYTVDLIESSFERPRYFQNISPFVDNSSIWDFASLTYAQNEHHDDYNKAFQPNVLRHYDSYGKQCEVETKRTLFTPSLKPDDLFDFDYVSLHLDNVSTTVLPDELAQRKFVDDLISDDTDTTVQRKLPEANNSASSKCTKSVILISYPHGGSKAVSSGDFTSTDYYGGELYNVATCMGCCGAPLISFTEDRKIYLTDIVHSGTTKFEGKVVQFGLSYYHGNLYSAAQKTVYMI